MIKYNNFDFQNFYKKYSNLDSEKLLKNSKNSEIKNFDKS